MGIDNRDEVRAFLTCRRAKVSPEQAGIPAYGSRRVTVLRRGEVAAIAGVSVEYYTRMERGNLAGASAGTSSGDGLELLATWAATQRSGTAQMKR